MKVYTAGVAALAFSLAATSVSLADANVSQGYARIKPALVKVWAFNANGVPTDSGTGFIVQSNAHQSLIVTALHVVARSTNVIIDVNGDARNLPASIIARTSEQRDIALLLIARGNLHVVRFATPSHHMVEGEYVATGGYFKYDERIGVSGQSPQLIGPGTIGALPDGGKFIEVNLSLEPGLSGAPVFDPGTGDVVGVVDTKSSIGQGGYAISAPLIVLDFLGAHQLAVSGEAALRPPVKEVPRPVPTVSQRATAVALASASNNADVDMCFGRRNAIVLQVIASCTRLITVLGTANGTALSFLYHNRGSAYDANSQYDLAIADYNQALHLDPNDAAAYDNRGYAYYGEGQYDLAVADENQALSLNPNDAVAYQNRGVAERHKGQIDLAISDYGQALRLDPNAAVAYLDRGAAYMYKGQYDLAILDDNQGIRLNPKDADEYYTNRGVAYSYKGQYDLAIADFNQAIRLNRNNDQAYFNRGNAYNNLGQYDLAIADETQGLRINPNYASAYTDRGYAYERKGQNDLAIADYNEAVRIDPSERSRITKSSRIYAP